MKRTIIAAIAIATTTGFASPAAAAICIGVSYNGGAINTVACDGGTGTANYNTSTNGFTFNIAALGFNLLTQPELMTQSIEVKRESTATNSPIVDVYITQSGLNSFNSSLLSSFTSNTITGATATISSYYSTSNALWGGTLLASNVFNAAGVYQDADPLTVTGPWSETVRYSLNFAGSTGTFNGTANLSAVPEPATWALMLLGFGGIGAALRRHRNPVRLAQIA